KRLLLYLCLPLLSFLPICHLHQTHKRISQTNILAISVYPLDQLDHHIPGSDSANRAVRTRKHDKVGEFWDFSQSKTKEVKPKALNQSLHSRPSSQHSTRPPSVVSQTCNLPLRDKQPSISSGVQDKPLPLPPTEAQPLVDIFAANLSKPTIKAQLPHLQERIERTEQL
ncbi:hypothetical protein BKA57DRAFT_496410, partial [Linnemannia elongata]